MVSYMDENGDCQTFFDILHTARGRTLGLASKEENLYSTGGTWRTQVSRANNNKRIGSGAEAVGK